MNDEGQTIASPSPEDRTAGEDSGRASGSHRMPESEPTGAPRECGSASRGRDEARHAGRIHRSALILGVSVLACYLANGQENWSGDTIPAGIIAVELARGRGVFLDEYGPSLIDRDRREGEPVLPYYLTLARGRLASTFPLGASVLAAPLTWPQLKALDWAVPDWERGPSRFWYYGQLAKISAAVITAGAVVAMFYLLHRIGLGRVAWPTALIAALGSTLWSTASQSLWQHGPATLALTLSMLCLSSTPPTRARLALAGFCAGALVWMRPVDLVFSATIFLWVALRKPRGLAWFLPPVLFLAAVLVWYNLTYFDDLLGGYSRFDPLPFLAAGAEEARGAPADPAPRGSATFTTPLREGLIGTLVSPSRGLFIYSPWILLALLLLPATARRLERRSVVTWLLASLLVYAFPISTHVTWWGGASYGPRYWTDAVPLFAVLLGLGLDWAWHRSRAVLALFGVAGVVSVAIHLIGVFSFPSSWHEAPVNVDTHRERLWDWSDMQIAACARECWERWQSSAPLGRR